ncbi:MAG: hypothetical protein AAB388_01980 [Patescibacteria group bacterium]
MWRAFLAVVYDLYRFAFGALQPAPAASGLRESVEKTIEVEAETEAPPVNDEEFLPRLGAQVYVVAESTPLLHRPVFAFDGQIGTFPFATVASVRAVDGQFAHVSTRNLSGWVQCAHLTEDKTFVYPVLTSGAIYSAEDKATKIIRRHLRDECLGDWLRLPLQSLEFILYTLKISKRKINWPVTRPRIGGTWHTLLRGQKGIKMDVEPKTGAVMEYRGDRLPDTLAYVESVAPDLTIKIASVGRFKEGEYKEERLAKAEWIELRPVFITVT